MSTAKSLLPLALFVVCVTGALGFFYFHSLEDELFLDVGGPNDEAHLRGFYAPENAGDLFYRWSSAHSFLFFPNRGHLPQVISIAADAPRPEGYGQPTISVLVNGDLLGQFVVEAGIREYSLQYVPRTIWPSDLVIQIDSPVFVPTNYPRELGVLVNTVILHSNAGTTLWSRLYLALMSALPGLMLITANYLILRLSRAPVGMLICLPGLLLILIGLGVCQGTVAMGLIVSLSLISAFVLVVVAVLLRLGQRPYLASRINRWGGPLE